MFENRITIVTGAARGIGLATAWKFAGDGASVVLADRDAKGAQRAAQELGAAGHTALPLQVDVSARESVAAMVEAVISRFGRIDVLVNNAGIAGRAAPILEVTDEDW